MTKKKEYVIDINRDIDSELFPVEKPIGYFDDKKDQIVNIQWQIINKNSKEIINSGNITDVNNQKIEWVYKNGFVPTRIRLFVDNFIDYKSRFYFDLYNNRVDYKYMGLHLSFIWVKMFLILLIWTLVLFVLLIKYKKFKKSVQ